MPTRSGEVRPIGRGAVAQGAPGFRAAGEFPLPSLAWQAAVDRECEESRPAANHAGIGRGALAQTQLGVGMEGVIEEMDRSASGFSALLERHRAIVFRVANSWCRHPDDRADLVQEIAAQLWRAWPAYDPQRSFTTWMYRIALNVAISSVRDGRQYRQNAVPLDEALHDLAVDNDGEHENEQHLRQLQAFIARQAPLERALLLLYLEERSQREIGEILGLSETNVSTRIGRLKQRIRNEF